MSSYAVIEQTSRELRQRIVDALVAVPDTLFGGTVPPSVQNVVLTPPHDEGNGGAFLSLFLYHIELDGHLRNQHWLASGDAGLRFPPFPLQLRYLITPLRDEEDENHLMLGIILQHFHDQPVFSSLLGTPIDDSHGGASAEFHASFEPLTMEQLAQVWHALEGGYRLSVAYALRVVAIDSARGVSPARRVTEKDVAVGKLEEVPSG